MDSESIGGGIFTNLLIGDLNLVPRIKCERFSDHYVFQGLCLTLTCKGCDIFESKLSIITVLHASKIESMFDIDLIIMHREMQSVRFW